jgi:hypothetical protein
VLCSVVLAGIAAALPAAAPAHLERPGYWPDPRADKTVTPAAGGRVPKPRSLSSALDDKRRGRTRVVCRHNSMARLRKSIERARRRGYSIRPADRRSLGAKRAKRLLAINKALLRRCRFHSIQRAVTASRNDDRVVILPGLYTEAKSRKAPTHDPKCAKYAQQSEHDESGAVSYVYQLHCPNDANLIAVMGRRAGKKPPPSPPRWNRRGIPDLGPCKRCNLQIEGSGVSADDVVVDAGRVKSGNGGPIGAKKDIGIRADRADGFVLRNLTVRHANEHGIYVLESDGYLLDRFKVFYNRLYGVLTFVEDHGLMQNCEAVGSGDSGLYPGASADTGEQRARGTRFRYSQEIRRCDMHHNLAGYSGTDGNAVHIDHDNFYDNALGLTTDVATAPGHPGFPQDSDLIEHNNFYANNFNAYEDGSDVEPASPFPVGTGMWIAGGDNNVVRYNHFFDNWRRGTMLFAVPDSLVCGPSNGNEQSGCDPSKTSTSHRNRFYGNVMGRGPNGRKASNGLDFWWDSYPGNKANCWYRNTGPRPITSEPPPPLLPGCNDGKDPGSSTGTGDPVAEGEIVSCVPAFETYDFQGPPAKSCPWFTSPSKPGSSAARVARAVPVRAHLREAFLDCAVRLGGCGGGPRAPTGSADTKPIVLQLFNCADWQRAGDATRREVIRRLRAVNGGEVSGRGVSGRGAVLPDAAAYRLFATYCDQRFARSFVLYKLYGRAAGFAGVAP